MTNEQAPPNDEKPAGGLSELNAGLAIKGDSMKHTILVSDDVAIDFGRGNRQFIIVERTDIAVGDDILVSTEGSNSFSCRKVTSILKNAIGLRDGFSVIGYRTLYASESKANSRGDSTSFSDAIPDCEWLRPEYERLMRRAHEDVYAPEEIGFRHKSALFRCSTPEDIASAITICERFANGRNVDWTALPPNWNDDVLVQHGYVGCTLTDDLYGNTTVKHVRRIMTPNDEVSSGMTKHEKSADASPSAAPFC